MRFRALAAVLAFGLGLAGTAEAKKPRPVNHRVSRPHVKPRKIKNRKIKRFKRHR